MRAAVLGANDGIISTASLIVGVAASSAKQSDVLIAGVAGLVAGAMSMAAGEYVSVSSQSDTEQADLARERVELSETPAAELDELAEIYVKRGVEKGLARQVAQQLMAKDALGAHARDELGMSAITTPRPVQAALTSAAMFCGRRGHASRHGRHIARERACAYCVGHNFALPRSSGSNRGENRRRQHSARHGPRDILGRAGLGRHSRYRESVRHHCLTIWTAQTDAESRPRGNGRPDADSRPTPKSP